MSTQQVNHQLETITIYYNNALTQVQKGSFLVFPDGREIPVDPSRRICNVLDVGMKGITPKRVVFYEDTEEDVQKWKQTQERTDRLTLIMMRHLCPQIEDENELKKLSREGDLWVAEHWEEIQEAYKKEDAEKLQAEIRKTSLQPKNRWAYLADGLAVVGGLYFAFKIVEFIVKKKPRQLLYGIFLAVKGTVYR